MKYVHFLILALTPAGQTGRAAAADAAATSLTPAFTAVVAKGGGLWPQILGLADGTLLALGYAGWQAGQLEQEMLENCWLNAPAGAEIIYDAPYERRWEFAAAQLGFWLQDLSSQIGHA